MEGCLISFKQAKELVERHAADSEHTSKPERVVRVTEEPIFFVDFQLNVSFSAKDNRVLSYGCVCRWL